MADTQLTIDGRGEPRGPVDEAPPVAEALPLFEAPQTIRGQLALEPDFKPKRDGKV